MLQTILLVLAAGLAALLAWVGLQPADFRVERSALINAAPSAVYEHVNDLRKWQAWSPWAERDPNAKAEFEGPPSGPGAIMRWDGNDEVGKGAMAITEARPGEALRIRLDFVRPFEGTSNVAFTFKPEGAGTRVAWSIDGTQGFFERLICTVLRLDMDRMIGADYEAGLANLKSVVEAPPG
jgi:uncharacterized protein YndB with AHSA1/START domain